MADHHPTLPPSSFPGFAACPQYVRDGGSNDAMEAGTSLHKMLECALNGRAVDYPDGESESKISWAINKIKERAVGDLYTERKVVLYDDDLEEITFGTADVLVSSPQAQVMDLKSGYPSKPYVEQLELYALAWMQEISADTCECIILYAGEKTTESWSISYKDAHAKIINIIDSVNRGDPARPCEFCEWCNKRMTCSALSSVAVKVATAYEPTLDLAEYHASKITDPAQMAKALAVAEILEDWSKSVKHHAKELARGGAVIPNYTLKPGRERREIIDILSGYKASGMTADEFLSCCSVSVPDLEKLVAKQLGNKSVTKAAKQELAARLGNLIEVKQGDMILSKEKK